MAVRQQEIKQQQTRRCHKASAGATSNDPVLPHTSPACIAVFLPLPLPFAYLIPARLGKRSRLDTAQRCNSPSWPGGSGPARHPAKPNQALSKE
eukprot:353752-Chlamydomonas_euryale.AAC.1